jgi:hypothetical protein
VHSTQHLPIQVGGRYGRTPSSGSLCYIPPRLCPSRPRRGEVITPTQDSFHCTFPSRAVLLASGDLPFGRTATMATRENYNERPAFSQWAEERVTQPPRFDNVRLDQVPIRERRDGQPATSPELAWNARRRHAPCHTRVPATCRVDSHYLRLDEEFEYVIRLSHILSVPGHASIDRASWAILAFSPPFAPYRWPILSRPTPFPRQEFAPEGEILVSGETLPRDSAYALYEASLAARAGDPGRFIAEFRKEARMRAKGRLVSWTQVEFHQIFPAHRADLYPEISQRLGRMGGPREDGGSAAAIRCLCRKSPHSE